MKPESCPCPVCETPSYRRIRANVGDFIRHELKLPDDVVAWSWLCEACDQVFSTPFLTEEQLGRYYQGYMSEDYCRRRVAVEPWFGPYIPHLTGADGSYDRIRFDFYRKMIDFGDIPRSVVDFGGGDGHFARTLFPKAKVDVMDVDGNRADADLLAQADCLFAAHVFEHVPQPRSVLRKLTSLLKPGCLVYIEVPIDFEGDIRSSFASSEENEARTGEPDGSALTLLHEHLTHYSKRSLGRLLKESGVRPVEFYVSSFCTAVLGEMGEFGAHPLHS